jgi:hypothetical protein
MGVPEPGGGIMMPLSHHAPGTGYSLSRLEAAPTLLMAGS